MLKKAGVARSAEEINLRLMEGLNNYARWQIDSISEFIQGNLLEVGGGTGTITEKLLLLPTVSSLVVTEINTANLQALKEKVGKRCKIKAVNLEEGVPPKFVNHFDTVVAVNVIEHVRDDVAFFRNCCRCLKDGGRIILIVPAMKSLYGEIDKADSHFRRYEKNDLLTLAETNRLKVEKLCFMNVIGALGWFLQGSVLRLPIHSKTDLSLFDRLVPFAKMVENAFHPPFGLSLVFVATKSENLLDNK